jgi:hypothetical protein
MKKILLTTLVALTLFVQHESHAMYGQVARNINRFGQQCAQRVAPAYRSFTTGLGQRVSNLRPQISQQFRSMQTSARNWSQNLNLPTARTTALGLGAGLTTATYLQRPNWQRPDIFGVVGAEEEEMLSEAPNEKKAEFIFEQLKSGKLGELDPAIQKELKENPDLTNKVADIVEAQIKLIHMLVGKVGPMNDLFLGEKLFRLQAIQHDINVIKRKQLSWWQWRPW